MTRVRCAWPAAPPRPRTGLGRAAAAVLRKAGRLADRRARRVRLGHPCPKDGRGHRRSAAWARRIGLRRRAVRPARGCNPDTRAGRAIIRAESGWDIRSAVANPDPAAAAASAIDDLENGATSLWVTVGGPGTAPADLARALDGVLLDIAPVAMTAAGRGRRSAGCAGADRPAGAPRGVAGPRYLPGCRSGRPGGPSAALRLPADSRPGHRDR